MRPGADHDTAANYGPDQVWGAVDDVLGSWALRIQPASLLNSLDTQVFNDIVGRADAFQQARAYVARGACLRSGDPSGALASLNSALRMLAQLDVTDEVRALMAEQYRWRAVVQWELGRFDLNLDAAKRALHWSSPEANPVAYQRALHNVGCAALDNDDPIGGLEYLLRSLEADDPYSTVTASAYSTLAELFWGLEHPELAARFADLSVAALDDTESTKSIEILCNSARCAVGVGALSVARERLARAEQAMGDATHHPHIRILYHQARTVVALADGDVGVARAELAAANELVDDSGHLRERARLNDLRLKVLLAEGRYQDVLVHASDWQSMTSPLHARETLRCVINAAAALGQWDRALEAQRSIDAMMASTPRMIVARADLYRNRSTRSRLIQADTRVEEVNEQFQTALGAARFSLMAASEELVDILSAIQRTARELKEIGPAPSDLKAAQLLADYQLAITSLERLAAAVDSSNIDYRDLVTTAAASEVAERSIAEDAHPAFQPADTADEARQTVKTAIALVAADPETSTPRSMEKLARTFELRGHPTLAGLLWQAAAIIQGSNPDAARAAHIRFCHCLFDLEAQQQAIDQVRLLDPDLLGDEVEDRLNPDALIRNDQLDVDMMLAVELAVRARMSAHDQDGALRLLEPMAHLIAQYPDPELAQRVKLRIARCRYDQGQREECLELLSTLQPMEEAINLQLEATILKVAALVDLNRSQEAFAEQQIVSNHLRLGSSDMLARSETFLKVENAFAIIEQQRWVDQHNLAIEDAVRSIGTEVEDLAHDLRSPLSVISLILSTPDLENGHNESPTQSRSFQMIRSWEMVETAATHALELVSSLSTRLLRGMPSGGPLDVRDVVDHCVFELQPKATSRDQELLYHRPPEPVWGYAIRSNLQRCVTNLLDNAIKYSPPRATTRIAIHHTKTQISIAVIDEGPGLSSTDLQRLFRRYEVAGRPPPHGDSSTGVGLNAVQRMMEEIGGSAQANSPGPGLGSTFTLNLPAADALSTGRDLAAEPAGSPG